MFTSALVTTLIGVCPFHSSQTIGWWKATNVSVERRNHTTESCNSLYLNLSCEPNGELKLQTIYRCDKFFDWHYSQTRRFSVTGTRLDGEDGTIKDSEFFWDSLVPNVSGSKVEMKLTSADQGSLVLSEDPQYYYPSYIFSATIRRISESQAPDLSHEPMSPTAFNGKWSGTLTINRRDFGTGTLKTSSTCPLRQWEIIHRLGVFHQTGLYQPSCGGERVSVYTSAMFLRDGVAYQLGDTDGLIQSRGTYDASKIHFEAKTGYMITAEDYEINGDKIKIVLTSKTIDLSRSPREQWTEYVVEASRD